mmetsp:Transcript_9854/g.30418  ORF Transcript_9854/g.30418 Transcript_9854/m.30418 type:complete len:245 (-) Transcript_9854:381-1115(-)
MRRKPQVPNPSLAAHRRRALVGEHRRGVERVQGHRLSVLATRRGRHDVDTPSPTPLPGEPSPLARVRYVVQRGRCQDGLAARIVGAEHVERDVAEALAAVLVDRGDVRVAHPVVSTRPHGVELRRARWGCFHAGADDEDDVRTRGGAAAAVVGHDVRRARLRTRHAFDRLDGAHFAVVQQHVGRERHNRGNDGRLPRGGIVRTLRVRPHALQQLEDGVEENAPTVDGETRVDDIACSLRHLLLS